MAASVTWSQTIDTMFASTWSYRKEGAIEQAYTKFPFWAYMSEKGRMKPAEGYSRIEVNIEYGENETATWLTKGGTVPLTENELMTVTYEDWKYIAVNIIRYGVEDQKNRGKARIVDYVSRKISRAEYALDKDFERVIFSDGTGVNEPNGLQNIISVTPTTGTLHGINRATAGNEFWQNLQYSSTGVTSVSLLPDMRTCLNNMSIYEGINSSDIFMVTTQSIYEALEDELLEYDKYTTVKLLEKEFKFLNYKGHVVMWAPSCPSGCMYFINPNYLYIQYDPGYFMDMTEWKAIPDQVNDKVAQIVCTMNMICTRPKAQLVMNGIVVG